MGNDDTNERKILELTNKFDFVLTRIGRDGSDIFWNGVLPKEFPCQKLLEKPRFWLFWKKNCTLTPFANIKFVSAAQAELVLSFVLLLFSVLLPLKQCWFLVSRWKWGNRGSCPKMASTKFKSSGQINYILKVGSALLKMAQIDVLINIQ